MGKSGYHTVLRIYLLFFLSLLGAALAAAVLVALLITVRQPGGSLSRSDWPAAFTAKFGEQIVFSGGAPQVRQEGLALLDEHGVGLQILDASGKEIYGRRRPADARDDYSGADLLRLYRSGAFAGTLEHGGREYVYLLYFPMEIAKVTMYLNGERFGGGKAVAFAALGVLLLSGVFYGLWMARAMRRLMASVREISSRSYLPARERGVFRDLHASLNALDAEIREGDRLRQQTDRLREEWIANLTHDLKTPLSPIRGYAELLAQEGNRYAGILLKNAACLESLIDDLKLTYRLENGTVPLCREEHDLVRFLRELAIDVLNTPEYEGRVIHLESGEERVPLSFDRQLLARAVRNLLVNAFVHGTAETEITLRVSAWGREVRIDVADNGGGMTPEETERLFDRYYRGAGSRAGGTGLGLPIARSIVELHGGEISVSSVPGEGSTFQIVLQVS